MIHFSANPGFYSMNLVMLGKMYDHFGDREMALQFLRRARDHKGVMVDDDWVINSFLVGYQCHFNFVSIINSTVPKEVRWQICPMGHHWFR